MQRRALESLDNVAVAGALLGFKAKEVGTLSKGTVTFYVPVTVCRLLSRVAEMTNL